MRTYKITRIAEVKRNLPSLSQDQKWLLKLERGEALFTCNTYKTKSRDLLHCPYDFKRTYSENDYAMSHHSGATIQK